MPQISTGLIAHSEAYSPLNWMVREVPGSIPSTAAAEGSLQKLGEFFLISKGSGYACLS